MQNHSKTCVVVLGMHRSGTSSLTRLFSIAGAKLPKTLLETRDGNESGHWESQKIVNFNEGFLVELGHSWHSWHPLNITQQQKDQYVKRIKSLLIEEYAHQDFIVVKDPRFCRFPKLLAQALTELSYSVKFTIISRNPLEVSESLRRRNNFSYVQSNLLWLRYVLDAEHYTRDYARSFVSFDHVIERNQNCLKTIAKDLSITWPNSSGIIEKKANEFINPSLKHHNVQGLKNKKYDLKGSWFEGVYKIFQNASNSQGQDIDRTGLDKIRSQLNDAEGTIIPLIDLEQSTYESYTMLRDKIQHIETKNTHATTELKQRNKEIKAFKKEQGKLISSLGEKDKGINVLKTERKKFDADIKQREKDIKALKKEQEKLISSLCEKDKGINVLKTERQKFDADIKQRNQDIKVLKKEQEKLTISLADKDKGINALKTERQKFDADIKQRNQDIEDLKKEQKKLVSNLTEKDKGINALKTERQKFDADIKQRNNDINALKKEQQKLVSSLSEKERGINALKAERQKFDADIKQRNNDINALKIEQEKLVSNLTEKKQDIKALKKEQEKLVLDLGEKDKDINALKAERQKFDADIKQRNKDIKALKREQEKLVSTLDEKDKNIDALQTEREIFVRDVTQRNEDIASLKKQAGALKRSITVKNNNIKKLNLNNTALNHTIGTLKQEFVDLEGEFRTVRDTHETQLKSHSEKVHELENVIEHEKGLNAHKAEQITQILNSRSWRLLSFPRKLSRVWKNKILYLIKFLGKNRFQGLEAGSVAISTKATLLARRDLAQSRSDVLNSKWHKALLDVENRIQDDELPNITISAVTYNSEKWLWDFFMSIINLDYPVEKITIYFVDNGSTDKGVEGIESFISTNKHRYRDMKVFRRPNKGYGVGNDYAIRQSKDDFVLVTNVDTELYTDSLKNVVNVAVNDSKDVACWEFRQTPYEHPKFYDPVTFLTNWTSHACVLIKKKAYMDVGGYDRKIFMYGEDVELSYRFRANGWKLRYVPSAVIKHYVDLEDATLRPNQLSGSVAANILLRYRFGSYTDILAGEALFASIKANEKEPVRMQAWAQVNKIINKNRWHFFKKRKLRAKAHFPFHEFDYDIIRPGAAVKVTPYKNLETQGLPKISIITRTHGKANEHLENVIASVLNQTYKNIEHIIVEDRTDDGEYIVRKMAKIYGQRIKYFKSDGAGRSYCGNYGASKATGQYLCWLDNDDVLYADHIETLVANLSKDPNAVCSYSLAWEALSEESNGQTEETSFLLPASHNQPYDKQRLLKENFIPIQAIIFEKTLFDTYGGFDETFSQLEDWNLWNRYAQHGPFIFTPKVTSFYRTPLDPKIRQARHELLHDAYETVQKANFDDIAKINKSLKPTTPA